jgi:hypothetical protein
LSNFDIEGGTFSQLLFQSSSGGTLFTMNNAAVTTINGTPEKAVISNSTIGTIYAGTLNFGRTKEISCSTCSIGTIKPAGSMDNNVDTKYAMSGGVIAIPNSNPPPAWAVPGGNAFFALWNGTLLTEGSPFQVVDIAKDASNTYVQTSLSGGFPSLPTDPNTGLSIHGHPAPKFTCTNCNGSPDAIDLSQTGAQGQPLFSYSKRTYTGSAQGLPKITIWGKIVKIAINVTTPYTGKQPNLMLNAFGDYGTQVISGGASSSYKAAVNLHLAGERDIFSDSATGSQSGDVISVPGAIWFQNVMAPSLNVDISGESPSVWPTFTIEITTDHGVVSP